MRIVYGVFYAMALLEMSGGMKQLNNALTRFDEIEANVQFHSASLLLALAIILHWLVEKDRKNNKNEKKNKDK